MRRKMAEDTSSGVVVSVFYVASLQSSQHRFKIDVNAQQLGLTGGVLICSAPDLPCALVVVEGGPRAVKRFSALMNRRIDWADTSELQGENYARNWAKEVWKGTTVRRNFAAFKFQECDRLSQTGAGRGAWRTTGHGRVGAQAGAASY